MSADSMEPMHDLVEEYALGLLDPAQRAAFERRLAADPALRRELAETTAALTSLAFGTPAAPRRELKERVMARVAAAPPTDAANVLPIASRARRSWTPIWLGAALAASLLLVASLSSRLAEARHQGVLFRQTSIAVQRSLAQRDSLIAQLTDPAVQLVTMAATGAARPAVRAYLDRRRHTLILSAAFLESPAAGQAYQLWFIIDGKPVPSVSFRPDSDGSALVRNVRVPAGDVSATAITREPEGGSTVPTTPILFVGKPAAE